MSRRDYRGYDDDRDSEIYRPPRRSAGRDREYDEIDVDITRSRYPEPRRGGPEAAVKERDTVVSDRRTERGPRQPDFLREDYGRNASAGPLVVREEKIERDDRTMRDDRTVRDEDTYSRAPRRRRSLESVKSKAGQRVEKEEITIRETERVRDRAPPYPQSDRGGEEKEEIVFRERDPARSRPPRERVDEEIDIKIRRDERAPPAPRSEAPPRSEYRERDVEEIRFRRGGGERPPPPRTEIDKEEIRIIETHRSPPQRNDAPSRGGDREIVREEIDIREERSAPAPRQRSPSRGQLIGRKREEWIVRRPRSPSPSPSPPPRDYEKEEIIIRRRERTPSPEPPPRQPSPEPMPAPMPPLEPIIRPPIIQEVITHHRHIDHPIERARSATPSPPPAPPSPPPREEELEIEIKRKGMRNGKYYEDDIIIDQERTERPKPRERERERDTGGEREQVSRRRSVSAGTRRRSSSLGALSKRRGGGDDAQEEADYYNRKVTGRGYPGEAYNGATKDWALVDVPPGTERVRMDGIGGGSQELTWQRYNGERRGKFYTGDKAYEGEFGNGAPGPRSPPPPSRGGNEETTETRITKRRITEETTRGKTKDKMWTELTKDLVIKEAIDEMGYEYEETEAFFYVMEYLRYEDVLRLVEHTEDIRRERRERIRELQWEREEAERAPKMLMPPPPPIPAIPPPPIAGRRTYDEKIYEREYVYDRDGRRYR